MIILDTQHISQLQLIGTDSGSRLKTRASNDCRTKKSWITAISPYEQLCELLGRINARSPGSTGRSRSSSRSVVCWIIIQPGGDESWPSTKLPRA